MSGDHACPVVWAADHDLLTDSLVDAAWCWSARREVVLAQGCPEVTSPELLLWRSDRLSIDYAPFDWVTTTAKVMLVGITPGHRQASEAVREVRRSWQAGSSNDDALRSANAVGSFSGPMRAMVRRGVAMLVLFAALDGRFTSLVRCRL